MVRVMGHGEASELLGVYALDAVEPDEAAALEQHLETCPRCRDELRSHREVVGVLAYSGQEAPEGLWDRVAAGISSPEGSESAPSLNLVPGGLTGAVPAGRPRLGPRGTAAVAVLAAAAVAVIALLGVDVTRLQNRTDHLSRQVSAMAAEPTMAQVRQALSTPGARVVTLRPATGGPVQVDAVILPSGQGYLYDSRLSPLSPAETYQLWGVVGAQRISYGVLGSLPSSVTAFRASSGVSALAVTPEVAGGVVVSDQKPVAVGFLN